VKRVLRLAAALACVLALPGAEAAADVAPTGAVGALVVSPQNGRVLVGIDGGRSGSWLFSSGDRGATWVKARGLAGSSGVTAIAFAPNRPDVVYAAALLRRRNGLGSAFYVSDDGGSTWTATAWKATVGIFGRQLPATVDTISVDPHRPRTVYAVTHGVLRRSLNGGASWAVARAGLPPTRDNPSRRTQQLAIGRGGTLYYATGARAGSGQVYRSVNRGDSWQPAGAGLPPVVPGWALLALASDPARGGVVYAATGRGLYRTLDSGRRWSRALVDPVTAVATARLGAATAVVAASQERGLVERAGAAWKPLGMPVAFDSFALDPADARVIYGESYEEDDPSSSFCAMVWVTADSGATWTPAGSGLPLVRRNCR
jgi:hypothetical protein